MRLRPDPIAYPPRGLSRDEAARYIGVGTTKLEQMVLDGRMPKPKRVDGRVIFDRLQLDAAFTELPEQGAENPLDRMFERRRAALNETVQSSEAPGSAISRMQARRKLLSAKTKDR